MIKGHEAESWLTTCLMGMVIGLFSCSVFEGAFSAARCLMRERRGWGWWLEQRRAAHPFGERGEGVNGREHQCLFSPVQALISGWEKKQP